jgi:preprotein translocase subunit YajC
MFTFALILPLLFLPCIYLWFLRRATAEAEAFAQLQDRLQEEEALLNNGGVTATEIIENLENVKLVSRTQVDKNNDKNSGDVEHEIWLLPYSATDASIGMKSDVKECCICMSDFPVQNEADLEDGLFEDRGNDKHNNSQNNNKKKKKENSIDPSTNSDIDESSVNLKECVIVRTKCGHVFHKECLSGWVGGRWQINPNNNTSTNEDSSQDRRRRRARQTCCPLCREDLRPNAN